MTDLNPCPFCGSNHVSVLTTVHDKITSGVHFDVPVAVVECFSCCAAAGFVKINEKAKEAEAIQRAVDLWNQRSDDFFEDYGVMEV